MDFEALLSKELNHLSLSLSPQFYFIDFTHESAIPRFISAGCGDWQSLALWILLFRMFIASLQGSVDDSKLVVQCCTMPAVLLMDL